MCVRVCLSVCEFPLLDAGGSSQESSLLFLRTGDGLNTGCGVQ